MIGACDDPHVVAVVAGVVRLGRQRPLVVDAPAIVAGGFHVNATAVEFAGQKFDLTSGRGWLRRYAPAMWGAGSVVGSLAAVEQRAFLGLVGSISRLGDVTWLTALESMLAAEDRLLQLQQAARAGARVPCWVVTSDADRAVATVGEPFVLKPLTTGFYLTDDGPRAVYAELFDHPRLKHLDLGAAPFVAQERIEASEHLRVVTVGDKAWACRISAESRPLDWREQDRAHREWEPANDPDACRQALAVADRLKVGYSSQDWVRDDRGLVFLDLNPGGQWLFLPAEVADDITAHIAAFLCGGLDG